MSDISVLFLSQVERPAGAGHHTHTHDYWHFSLSLKGTTLRADGSISSVRPTCSCFPAGELNTPSHVLDRSLGINVMFLVHNKALAERLAAFPFSSLSGDEMYPSLLQSILSQIHEFHPDQSFVDSAFSYYLHLLLSSHKKKYTPSPKPPMIDKALSFIEENYMKQIRLEDIAKHIGRSPYHTSHLFKSHTGTSLVEHIRKVRIRNACDMLAYSNISIDEIIVACGFIDQSYFYRMFKNEVGITPKRYRTSHETWYTYYDENDASLDTPYTDPVFTYFPGAQKCIDWKTPREYLSQTIASK